jgi:hypothetical protein
LNSNTGEEDDTVTSISSTTIYVTDQTWTCELDGDDFNISGQEFVHVKGLDDEFFITNNVSSGETTLMSPNAYIMGSDIFIPESSASDITLGRASKKKALKNRGKRSQETSSGEDKEQPPRQLEQDIRTVLVVRVESTTDGSKTTPSESKLRDDVFEDDVCLASQYAACSHGKLHFVPATFDGLVNNGVITVRIHSVINGVSTDTVQSNVVSEVNSLFGEPVSDLFDHIMLCLPPGTVSSGSTSW